MGPILVDSISESKLTDTLDRTLLLTAALNRITKNWMIPKSPALIIAPQATPEYVEGKSHVIS